MRRATKNPPSYITLVHFAFLWLFYYKEIMSRIAELDEEHTINRSKLRVPNTVKRRCEEWHHRLRTEWPGTDIILRDLEVDRSPYHVRGQATHLIKAFLYIYISCNITLSSIIVKIQLPKQHDYVLFIRILHIHTPILSLYTSPIPKTRGFQYFITG